MSTRANIIIKDKWSKLCFYRHSDGYPEGTLPTLEKFIQLVKDGKIKDNVSQSAGWLIIIGAVEYQCLNSGLFPETNKRPWEIETDKLVEAIDPKDWKVGAYEPTDGIHGDIEHLYVIDLETKTISEIPEKDWKSWE